MTPLKSVDIQLHGVFLRCQWNREWYVGLWAVYGWRGTVGLGVERYVGLGVEVCGFRHR